MMSRRRLITEKVFEGLVLFCGIGLGGLSLGVLGLILIQGGGALSWEFVTLPMRESGLSGGVRDPIIGSVILLVTTLGVVVPLALGLTLLRSVYLERTKVRLALTLAITTLNGVPSILFGLFGYFVFVKALGWGKSWLTGGILLAMMILPTVVMAWSEGMDRVASEYRENARALGLTRDQMAVSVLLPQSFSSFLSGLWIGLARAVGETAPIMFTATVFSGAGRPRGIVDQPVLSLPYHIFTLAQESYQPAAMQNAWGSACVLVGMVLVLSFLALPFRLRAFEEARA